MKIRFALAFLVPLLSGCVSFDPCENVILQTIVSPDGARKVVVFSRGCGATTSESTQIALLPPSSNLGLQTGNVLVFRQVEAVTVRWKDARTVEISYPKSAGQPWKASLVDGVRFQYLIQGASILTRLPSLATPKARAGN